MIDLGYESPSIVPSLGGAFVFIEGNEPRMRSVVFQTKERLKIFSIYVEEILLSIHGKCKWIAKKGISFADQDEETEKLIEFIEVSFPIAKKHFNSYNLPIRGIVFPSYVDENHPPPIILDFN